jgi:hypothetical protein
MNTQGFRKGTVMVDSRRAIRVLVAAALWLAAGAARAQGTFSVDNTQAGASDANDGSAASPWRTLGRCAAAMAAGSTWSPRAACTTNVSSSPSPP